MEAGQTVEVRVNGGKWCIGQVIAIHGDMVRIAGEAEMRIVRASGRAPLGIAFRVRDIRLTNKAKTLDISE